MVRVIFMNISLVKERVVQLCKKLLFMKKWMQLTKQKNRTSVVWSMNRLMSAGPKHLHLFISDEKLQNTWPYLDVVEVQNVTPKGLCQPVCKALFLNMVFCLIISLDLEQTIVQQRLGKILGFTLVWNDWIRMCLLMVAYAAVQPYAHLMFYTSG